MREGTLVDATIINTPSSTKNKDRARDPERPQTKRSDPWYFGMKASIGTERDSGIVHTVISTAGNLVVAARKLVYSEGEEGRGGQKSPPEPRNRH
jgi:transposase, IS5 family